MTQSAADSLPPPKDRRRLRRASSLSRGQVAARLGVSRKTVRSWETGRATPRARERVAYTKLLRGDTTASASPSSATSPAGTGAKAESGPATDTLERPNPPNPKARSKAKAKAKPDRDCNTVPKPQARSKAKSKPSRNHIPSPNPNPAPRSVLRSEPRSEPQPEPTLTPTQAFDTLYTFCAPTLVRQAYLLTGRRDLACESVERAFQLAWQRWPEVAADPDPAGWARAAAYEYATAPQHRLRLRYRTPQPPPATAADRHLLSVLLRLPPSYRRTLLLHDGLGIGLPETAAETEATTRAAANRLLHAREALTGHFPELADPHALRQRLNQLAGGERLRVTTKPGVVRAESEHRAGLWTRAAIALTTVLIGSTGLTLLTAQDHYEPPMSPVQSVLGVPPPAAPGPLSPHQVELRKKLKAQSMGGPARLTPEAR
ncbi:helix-turn-helix domain-containing protein [Streptomyces sporangiiformans]|uniref:helix-turn-helix domain-containing protein n=1 Tax=Streptomyces sporangiiformans TaxID=2315329 RepID=UPI001F097DBD|nr:helix-turn-helix domain-containing protein [Streptomyces sporangiiformans]